jgi:hypothetical protein
LKLGQDQAITQIVLPMEQLMSEVALAVENMASKARLLLMKRFNR